MSTATIIPRAKKNLAAAHQLDDAILDLVIQASVEHAKRRTGESIAYEESHTDPNFYPFSDPRVGCDCCKIPCVADMNRHCRTSKHVATLYQVGDHSSLVFMFSRMVVADGLRSVHRLFLNRPRCRDLCFSADLGL